MRRKLLESRIHLFLVIASFGMIILRFLLNEKGRTTPDSIRFMRTSHVFPVIDNTTTPLGYPLSIKLFTVFGLDEFWASKVIGILSYFFIVFFAAKKKFYVRETILLGGLFSFVSIFSATLSEALMLPVVFVFLYVARQIIIGELKGLKAFVGLSLMLVLLYNVRYPALFIMGAVFLGGILNFKKHYSRTFIYSAVSGFAFVVLYKFLFIDYFNENYVDTFLNIGVHSTAKLLSEFLFGMATAFNPFIHIASPGGGLINFIIYGTGILNIILIGFLFIRNRLSETEKFFVLMGVCGIACTFLVQYFYVVDPLDYRLLAPFTFPIWLVFFKKLYSILGKYTYGITAISIVTGLAFIILTRADYLENRSAASKFLTEENIKNTPLTFYIGIEKDFSDIQLAELLSTVNPDISITSKPQDTLKKNTLTPAKVLRKIKIDTNRFQ